jgi:hypothetical protein
VTAAWTIEPIVDQWGNLAITDSEMPTYSCAIAVAPVATPTDTISLFLPNTSTKTIRLRKLIVSALATAAWGPVLLSVVRRSTANTGGLPTTGSVVAHNTSVANDGVVASYGVNPAGIGTALGTMAAFYMAGSTTMFPPVTLSYDVGFMAPRIAQPGGVCLNLGGAAIPAGLFLVATFVWSETT